MTREREDIAMEIELSAEDRALLLDRVELPQEVRSTLVAIPGNRSEMVSLPGNAWVILAAAILVASGDTSNHECADALVELGEHLTTRTQAALLERGLITPKDLADSDLGIDGDNMEELLEILPPELREGFLDLLEEGLPEDGEDGEDFVSALEGGDGDEPIDLGGMSPAQVCSLLADDVGGANSPLKLALLPAETAVQTPFMQRAAILLQALARQGAKLDQDDFLETKFVVRMASEMQLELPDTEGPLNELFLPELSRCRVALETAGYLEQKGQKLKITKRGSQALEHKNIAGTYRDAFKALFNRVDLAYLDPLLEFASLQNQLPFTFGLLRNNPAEWVTLDLADGLVLYLARAEWPMPPELLSFLVYVRVLLPLTDFGLLDLEEALTNDWEDFRFRKSPLFDEFISLAL